MFAGLPPAFWIVTGLGVGWHAVLAYYALRWRPADGWNAPIL